jgi:hypothetical protein
MKPSLQSGQSTLPAPISEASAGATGITSESALNQFPLPLDGGVSAEPAVVLADSLLIV